MKQFVKFARRVAVVALLICLCGVVFRGFMFRQLFSYKPIAQRTNYPVTNEALRGFIEDATASFRPRNVNDIIETSLRLTASVLEFSQKRNNNDPNKLLTTIDAHCVGYAAFFSATCNYLLQKHHYSDRYTSEAWAGQIYFCGINIHNYSRSSFFKDHDFNVIVSKTTAERYYVDPVVNDYFEISYVRAGQ